ncbi:Wzz/FepE/Etk N-terminal domain-containing protein [Pseudomonadales bacterium]|nr:Wzz/FepE/Etk N-terminal domain-containing protein [Pseudomonadales bacterium]
MIDDSIKQPSEGYDDEIDLRELFLVLWQGKTSIVIGGLLGAILSVGYALSLPNIYTAEAVMAPKAEGSGLSGLAGQFGGLAGLAGIDIGGGEASKTQIALETIKSRSFFAKYMYEDVLVPLMAAEGWDRESGKIIVDEELYDPLSQQWVRDVQAPSKKQPSVQEAYKEFSNLLLVTEDKKTGFVGLAVKHYSPNVARDWVLAVLRGIETSIREKEVQEAERSIAFLKAESAENSLISLNEVFASLIEEQTKKIVLAKASEEYVFEVIEPPVAAELKSEPKRSLICILGTLLSGMLSVLYVLIKHYAFKKTGLTGV